MTHELTPHKVLNKIILNVCIYQYNNIIQGLSKYFGPTVAYNCIIKLHTVLQFTYLLVLHSSENYIVGGEGGWRIVIPMPEAINFVDGRRQKPSSY
jgi:hypothetical protein